MLLVIAAIYVLPACDSTDNSHDPDPVSFDPPPPPRHEPQMASPGPQHVWVPGHWKWERKQYMWEPGYWKVPPHRNKTTWVPGYWEQRARGWVWVDGYWR
jgi:hypothetical protein